MNRSALVVSFLLVAAAAFGADPAKPDKPAEAKGGMPAMDPKAMAAMEALGKVGPEHKALEAFVGTWKATTRIWMDPGQPPMTSEGTSEKRLIFGGRYLEERHNGSMMGQPFEGRATSGFDNHEKKYVSTWIDSMSTTIFMAWGTAAPDGKAIAFTGEMYDPMVDKEVKIRFELKVAGPDQHLFEWYQPGPDGKEYKSMDITYTRVK